MAPTALGWKALAFYAVLVGAFFATPYANLFFLLLAFLTVLAPFCAFWAHGSTRDLRIERVTTTPAATGSDAPIAVEFSARQGIARLLPHLTTRVVVRQAGKKHTVIYGTMRNARCTTLDDRDRVTAELAMPTESRGVFDLDRIEVRSTYPFGLVRRTVRLDLRAAPVALHVFPKPMDGFEDDLHAALARELGLPQLVGSGAAVELRDYRSGDELRRIHWRKSAGRPNWIVREAADEFDPGHEIVLDRRCAPESLEHSLRVLAAIGVAARSAKENVHLRTQGYDRLHGEGHASYRQLLEFLAECSALAADAEPPPAAGPAVPRLPAPDRAQDQTRRQTEPQQRTAQPRTAGTP